MNVISPTSLQERPCGPVRCTGNLLCTLKKSFLSPKREPQKTGVSHAPLMWWCLVDRRKPPWPCDSQAAGSQHGDAEDSWNEPSFEGNPEPLRQPVSEPAQHLDFLIRELNIYLWFMSWGLGFCC